MTSPYIFGDLERNLNSIGSTLIAVSVVLVLLLPIFYGLEVFIFTLVVNEDMNVNKFYFLHKLLNACFIANLIFFLNVYVFFHTFKTKESKWTPKSDLAFTCVLTSNILAILFGIVLTMMDYNNFIAIFAAFAITLPSFLYFLTTITAENFRVRSDPSEHVSLSEKCSILFFIICIIIQFLILTAVSPINLRTIDSSDYLVYRNLIASMFSLTILNVINYIINEMLEQEFKASAFISTTQYVTLEIINGILIFSEFAIIVIFLHNLSKIMFGLLIACIIHGMIYVAKMHLFICFKEQSILQEEESELKRKQDLVDNLSGRIEKIAKTIFSVDESARKLSFEAAKSYFTKYQELHETFTKKISYQIKVNDTDPSIQDFKNELEALETNINSSIKTTSC